MDLLHEFLKHNTMMNDRLLASCEGLSPEQLGTAVPGTYGELGATLVHIARGQDSYAARFHGTGPPRPLSDDPFPGFAVLKERLTTSNKMLEEAALLASDGRTVQVSGDDPVGTWDMPGALLLLQAVNHGTEHRSQVSTILTQLGVEPPDMSGWAFFFAAGHMSDA